jgi:CheY-like chemotaxis protein
LVTGDIDGRSFRAVWVTRGEVRTDDDMAAEPKGPILVVEDDPIIAFDLETIVADLAVGDVVVFTSGPEALAWLETGSPGAAILDWKLSTGTSLDAAALLVGRRIPIAFVTGYGQALSLPPDLSRCPVFDKPVDRGAIGAWLLAARGPDREGVAVDGNF